MYIVKNNRYDIVIEKNNSIIKEYLIKNQKDKNKILILSDNNIPNNYITDVINICDTNECLVYKVNAGEDSKCIEQYTKIIEFMLKNNFQRNDLIINLGGGVVSDLGTFVASNYKRGIAYINMPTSLLAMVDASIGSKCGINFGNIKNAIGSFYDPLLVFVNTNYLVSLDKRQIRNGLFEVIKASLISSKKLFSLIENSNDIKNIDFDEIIKEAIEIKNVFVMKDYYDIKERHLLNFGHTIAHAIEKTNIDILHGEAVGIGMLYFVNDEDIKNRLLKIYDKLNFDYKLYDNALFDKYIDVIKNDKKCKTINNKTYIDVVVLDDFEKARIETKEI